MVIKKKSFYRIKVFDASHKENDAELITEIDFCYNKRFVYSGKSDQIEQYVFLEELLKVAENLFIRKNLFFTEKLTSYQAILLEKY